MGKKIILVVAKSLVVLMLLSMVIFYFENSILSESYQNFLLKFSEFSVLNVAFIMILQIIILSLGVPSTPLIILNLIFFSTYGFLISITSIFISSLIIFKFSIYISKLFKLENKIGKYSEYLKNKNFFIKVFISRFIIPGYFHNLIFGLINSNINTFMAAILLSDFIGILIIYLARELI